MDLSVIIPARNEQFLQNTIDDVLKNIKADTEVIVILDGYWPKKGIPPKSNLTIIHHEISIGQRAAVNEAAKLSQSKYIMKLDAHCIVDEGFDIKLMADCEYDWTVIPTMYNLHAFNWTINFGTTNRGGGFRDYFRAGSITLGDVVSVIPFENNLMKFVIIT